MERNTLSRNGDRFVYPVKAATTVEAGTLVCLSAGLAVPGAEAVGLMVVGIADGTVENTGADGDLSVGATRGTYLLENDTGDPITAADAEQDCYMTGPYTVARTDGGGTRSRAGRIRTVEGGGVWVTI